jgi:hypothetical protein
MSKSTTKVTPTQELFHKTEIPTDYHCTCNYCTTNFLGEIYDTEHDRPYSASARYCYYPKRTGEDKHLDPGHFQGYRWAIQQFTEPGDWILDPTVGTGTAIVEAVNNGRNGIGIEIEYPHITQEAIQAQYDREAPATGEYLFRQGNAKLIKQYLDEWNVEKNSLQLIINGTPYPTIGAKSSDSPERKAFTDKVSKEEREYFFDDSFDYNNPDNFGTKKGSEFWNLVDNMYWDSVEYLKPGGYFVVIIKDMTQNGKPYLLHKMVIDHVLEKGSLFKTHNDLEYHGAFIHKHYPPTLHMNTYPVRFPDRVIPLYQTGIVLRKKL